MGTTQRDGRAWRAFQTARHQRGLPRAMGCLVACVSVAATAPRAAAEVPYEEPPINYLKAEPTDPVAQLMRAVDKGKATLQFDAKEGYLPDLLRALDIAPSSQMLVFSKTSFQRTVITPASPRAIFFNDDVYVGYVPEGDVIEVSAADPMLGGTFYLVDQARAKKPEITRQTHDCLQCHISGKTEDVPGHLMRSVYPADDGQPIFNAGTFATTDESPLKERWGGWYVTGKHGKQTHMGNVMVQDRQRPEILDVSKGANVADLSKRIDLSPYPSPHSDLVALMVLGHQLKTHNLITVAQYQARIAVDYAKAINKALGRPENEVSESTMARIKGPVEDLVKYMLFTEEAELTGPVAGTSDFAREFAARGPRDSKGRSLRDFDLKTRLFRYPCSYLIYSKSFDALPEFVQARVYKRLREVLTGEDRSETFSRRTPEQRQAILEILKETKPSFANNP